MNKKVRKSISATFTLFASLAIAVALQSGSAHASYSDPSYESPMNKAEKSWCKPPSRWRLCDSAYLIEGAWAINNATACKPPICNPGEEQNAFQHCLWSAVLKLKHGERTALGFLERHEKGSKDLADTERDWKNNYLGFEVARLVANDIYVDPRINIKKGVLDRCTDLAREERLVYRS